jgi:hypothetical protein
MSESGYLPKNADAVASTRLDVLASLFARLVAAGLATEAEISQHVDNVSRGLVTPLMAPLITVWGRK